MYTPYYNASINKDILGNRKTQTMAEFSVLTTNDTSLLHNMFCNRLVVTDPDVQSRGSIKLSDSAEIPLYQDDYFTSFL